MNGLLLRIALLSPLRFKVPKTSRGVSPTGRDNLVPLLARWDDVRDAIGEAATSIASRRLRGAVFNHPVAGSLNLEDTLSFVDAHFKHHLRQISRLLRDAERNLRA
jgi:hypothetical protein